MFRLMFEDTRYRILCSFCTNCAKLDDGARRWLAAFDKEIGLTGFALSRSYKLYAVAISARIVAFMLRPIWWMRGY